MYGLLADKDKQQAIYQGLLGLGAGLIQGSGPSSAPQGLLGGVGQGFAGFQQGMQGYADRVQKNKMASVQMEEIEDQKRQREARAEALKTLSPEEQTAALLGGDQFWKAKYSQKDTRTPAQKNAEALGLTPGTPQYADYLRQATLPGQNSDTFETVQSPFGRGGIGQRNSRTGQVVNYQAPDQLTQLRQLDAYIEQLPMNSPVRPTYVALRDKLTNSKPLVNVDMGTGADKGLMGRYETAQGGYQSSSGALDKLEALSKVVDKVESGFGAETALEAQKLLARVGFNVDTEAIANAELLRKFSLDSVMDIVAQTKGAVSNKEMEMFLSAAPSLANSKAGNRKIVEYSRKMVERKRDLDSHMANWVRQNRDKSVFDYDAEMERKAAELRGQPMFGENDLMVLTGGGPGAGGSVLTPEVARQKSSDELRSVLGN